MERSVSPAVACIVVMMIVVITIAVGWAVLDRGKKEGDPTFDAVQYVGEYTLDQVVSSTGFMTDRQWACTLIFKEEPDDYFMVTTEERVLHSGRKYELKMKREGGVVNYILEPITPVEAY